LQDKTEFISLLQTRLQHPLPGRDAQERMGARVKSMPATIPADAKPSAVLCLFFPLAGEWNILFIKRTVDGHAHSGQISFPGGRQEPEDADLKATALREAQEEVGVMSADVEIIGSLTQLYIPVSNFQVFPFVGYSQQQPKYNTSKSEVAYILEIPVKKLFHKDNKITTEVRPSSMPGLVMNVPAYNLENDSFIWGATAMILSELEEIIKTV
jgi:hypothetical protein